MIYVYALSMEKPIFDIVIYHRNCLDGFMSLLVAYLGKVLKEGDKLWFHASGADEGNAPHVNKSKNVLMLDVNMKYSFVKNIVDNANIVYMVDHHSNKDHDLLLKLQRELPGKFVYMYDEKESASTLTWKWLFPSQTTPRALKYIRDSDLGLWENKETQRFILGLEVRYNTHHGLGRDTTYAKLEKWKELLVGSESEAKIDKLLKLGKKMKLFQNLILERMEINAEIVEITNPKTMRPMKVVVSNGCVYIGKKLPVRLAKKFRDKASCAIVWYYHVTSKKIQCVVRSDTENILWLIQMYGGGGHPKAGTFSYPARDIYKWMADHEDRVRSSSRL